MRSGSTKRPLEAAAGVTARTPAGAATWFVRLFVFALLFRVLYILQLRACPWYAAPIMDPDFHNQWARFWAQGEPFMRGPYFRAPLYTWFLGTIYWLIGTQPVSPRIVQALVGSANCGLLYLLGRQLFGHRVGLVAGGVAAVYWVFWYFDAELLSPVLIAFLNLLLLLALVRLEQRATWWEWGAAGVLLGLSAVARPDILIFAPLIFVWLLVLQWRRRPTLIGHAACLVAGTLIPILPVTVRNYVVGHDRVLIATNGGVNFYIGNGPNADGTTAVIYGDPAGWTDGYIAQVKRAEDARGRKLKPSEVSDFYYELTFDYFAAHPGEVLARMLRKAGYFWTRWEIPNNQDIYFVVEHYTPIVRWVPIGFWLVGPLGFAGLLYSFTRGRRLVPLWGYVLAYWLVAVLFFTNARYREPAVYVLILLGCFAVERLIHALRTRAWRHVGVLAGLVIVGGVLVWRVPSHMDFRQVQAHQTAATSYLELGDFQQAAQMAQESLRRARAAGLIDHPLTYHALGTAQLHLGDYAAAERSLRKTLEIAPTWSEARLRLATTLAREGRFPEAVAQYEQVLAEHPDSAAAHGQLGNVLAGLGQFAAAFEHLHRAVELDAHELAGVVDTIALLQHQQQNDAAQTLTAQALQWARAAQQPEYVQKLTQMQAAPETQPR